MHEDGDQYSMLKPVCKRCWRVDDVEALPYILDWAFRLAESGRPGPVLVDIPMDMFSREMEEDLWSRTYRDSHAPVKPALDPAAVKAIARKLVEAERPVLHAGGGILLARPRRSWLPWRSSWTSPSPAPWPDRAACLTGTP